MKSITALWRGEYPLGYAFWAWAVAGGLLLNITATMLGLILMANDMPFPAFLSSYGVSIPYNVVVVIGVWRSAAKYGGPEILANLARGASAILMSLLSLI